MIYNADEFGLFYQCVPNKTYQLKSEKCSGGKLSKVRITGMASANAAGDKLSMFIIGKARKSRCFKNVKFLPSGHMLILCDDSVTLQFSNILPIYPNKWKPADVIPIYKKGEKQLTIDQYFPFLFLVKVLKK